MKFNYNLSFLLLIPCIMGCSKSVTIDPPITNLVSQSVFSSNATASAAVTGIYEQMEESSSFIGSAGDGTLSFTSIAGVSADELEVYPSASQSFLLEAYSNSLTSKPALPFWATLYNFIYYSNEAIEGLATSNSVTLSLKQQLMGEVKFIRAFCHFYLVNIYGDVPLVTTTNYKVNSASARTPKERVYQQIISDLIEAQRLLGNDYLSPSGSITTERVRPTKNAATALLARTYLYEQKWDSAALEATTIIGNSSMYGLTALEDVFLANSKEAIWQLQSTQQGFNTSDGYTFILTSGPNAFQNPLYLDTVLLNQFEAGDNRFSNWVGIDSSTGTNYYYPYKYKSGIYDPNNQVTEYLMVLRLAEQYLIRAEAEANGAGGGISGALIDLNVIRVRAGLSEYSGATDRASILKAIIHERQIELFTEWGHRWLDLKRTGTIDAVMSSITPLKGGIWNTTKQLFPIPLTEIQLDPNLTQNPGYN